MALDDRSRLEVIDLDLAHTAPHGLPNVDVNLSLHASSLVLRLQKEDEVDNTIGQREQE